MSSYPITGIYASYLGGGFVFVMSGGLNASLANLTALQQNNWIDRQTRAVFVEFNLFNPNLNLFAYCYILYEILPTGDVLSSFRFYPMVLFDDRTNLYSFVTIAAVIYLVMVFILSFKQIYRIVIHKMKYFKQFWTYLDLALIAFSFTSFAIWLYRVWEAQSIMSIMASNLQTGNSGGNKMINLQMLAYWDETLTSMLSFCAALGTLKFMKLLEFNRSIKTLGIAFRMGFANTTMFFCLFTLMIFSWLQFAFVIFNDRIVNFSTFIRTLEMGFLLLLGKFSLGDMLNANPVMTVIFHVSFNVFVIFIMFNLFLTLICESLNEAKADEKLSEPLHMEDFVAQRVMASVGFARQLFNKSPELREQKELERKMKESVAKRGLYVEVIDNFANKTEEIVQKLQMFKSVSHKDDKYI
jgi:hypothetical protein